MSAKWRRSKKSSKWFDIIKDFNRIRHRRNPNPSGIRSLKIRRQEYPYRYTVPKVHSERRWREPKPLIDVIEEKNEIIVVAEFAGFKRENLEISLKNQRLTLSAEAVERKYYKSLNLPKRVIPNTMRTVYKNGVLEIRLKKSIEEKAIDRVVG